MGKIRIGRNDPCPCGSGKKYKKCHLGHKFSTSEIQASLTKTDFRQMIKPYRGVPILKFLAYLQTIPKNHGHNFDVEIMAREVLDLMPENDDRPFMSWQKLIKAVSDHGNSNSEEPYNLFTENILFSIGNQIVFPGVYRNASSILNEHLTVILTGENSLPEDFKKIVYSGAGILLYLSNQIAVDLDYKRNKENTFSEIIELPTYEDFIKHPSLCTFDAAYLEKISNHYNFDISIIQQFVIDLYDPLLKDDDPESNVVSIKPLFKDGSDYIVYMPTTIVSSLISFIHIQAKIFGCYDALIGQIVNHQCFESHVALDYMSWKLTDIELPENATSLSVIESVFQFDNQKFGYLCVIDVVESGEKIKKSQLGDLLNKRNSTVVQYLKSIGEKEVFETLSLIVLSESGNDCLFSIPKLNDGDQHLILTFNELKTIAYDNSSDILTLWKFAAVHKETGNRFRIINFAGLLNLYGFYRGNYGSLLNSDIGYSEGTMLTYINGSDLKVIKEVRADLDEHLANIFTPEQQFGFVPVIKSRKYAPIYSFKYKSFPEYKQALECYKMPIWITNYQKDGGLLVSEFAEAIMFWLFRLQSDLVDYINSHDLIQFEIELIIDEKFINGVEFEIKDIEPESVEFNITIAPPKIQIFVPTNFLYLIARNDNLGEKMLVKAVLKGIVQYITAAGKQILLTDEDIDMMVENELKPDNAKMILFTDVAANVELDERNLPPEHYISDVDTSFVLDNLVTYLPAYYVIPEKIHDTKQKIKLCDDIVKGLIDQLTNRISGFDVTDLLTWLIKWNERCVYTREIRQIRTPAKISCFTEFEDELQEILEADSKLVPTAHSIRTLIEFTSAISPKGNLLPNYADLGILIALTNQLTTWGAISEGMRMGISDPEMGLLSSGRIGTDKNFYSEVISPFAYSRSKGLISNYIDNFNEKYVHKYKTDNEQDDETRELDAAFEDEFGITLTEIAEISGALIDYGFSRVEACSIISKEEIFNILLSKLPTRCKQRIEKGLEMMTLLQRKGIGVPPAGYTAQDIFPWRYGRNISYLRRPLAYIENGDRGGSFLFGYRHIKAFYDNLIFLIFSGKIPESASEKMSAFIGKILGEKGTPYRNEVAEWLKNNTTFEVIPYEVKIKAGGHIIADKDYGDVDVMAIDHSHKIIYSLECKNIVGARNIHEMKVELDLYLGREGKKEKAKIIKHVNRDIFLKAHPKLLHAFLKFNEDYEIKSIILASEEMPLAYLAKEILPLPVFSFSQFKDKVKNNQL